MASDHPPGPNGANGTFSSAHDPEVDPAARLRHDLKGALTGIRAQAQLLSRRVARLNGLDPAERAWLLERAARIDAAIMTLAAQIEQIGTGPNGDEER